MDLDADFERDRDFLLDAREDALDDARDPASFSPSEPAEPDFSVSWRWILLKIQGDNERVSGRKPFPSIFSSS